MWGSSGSCMISWLQVRKRACRDYSVFSDAGVRKRNGEGGKRHAAKVELAISTRHIGPGAPLGFGSPEGT